jgi:hypothetical protein
MPLNIQIRAPHVSVGKTTGVLVLRRRHAGGSSHDLLLLILLNVHTAATRAQLLL